MSHWYKKLSFEVVSKAVLACEPAIITGQAKGKKRTGNKRARRELFKVIAEIKTPIEVRPVKLRGKIYKKCQLNMILGSLR